MKRVLITGGWGFIGRYLVTMMAKEGWYVVAPHKHELNVTSPDSFEKFHALDFDVVIHLAAKLMIHGFTPQQYFDVNTIGTFNVLEFCRKEGIPRLVYGMTHSDTNMHQKRIFPYGCQDYGTSSWENNSIPFIQSKVAAADMIETYNKQKVLKGFILRLSNIRGYGSNDTKYNSPFHQFIDKARKGWPIEVWGNPPKTKRDFVYIKDVCRAFIDAASVATNECPVGYYNIGSGKALTVLEEVEAICKVFCRIEYSSEIIMRPDIEEVRKGNSLFDISRTRLYFGWRPRYSYEAALVDYKQEAGW